MSDFIPFLIVMGIFAMLIIFWLWIAARPQDWLGDKPPPSEPQASSNPDTPATRSEVQARAKKSASLASQGQRGIFRKEFPPMYMNRKARRALAKIERKAA